jgi:hypothetical protein
MSTVIPPSSPLQFRMPLSQPPNYNTILRQPTTLSHNERLRVMCSSSTILYSTVTDQLINHSQKRLNLLPPLQSRGSHSYRRQTNLIEPSHLSSIGGRNTIREDLSGRINFLSCNGVSMLFNRSRLSGLVGDGWGDSFEND